MPLINRNSIMQPHKSRHLKVQRGFTLLEVLIALLVLSIGLLGLAALQTVGLRSNQMAVMRTQATHMAYDITDRIRAKLSGTYVTDANNNVTNVLQDYVMDACPPDNTTPEMALTDLTEWCNDLSSLPGGQGEITQTISVDNIATYTVTVYWDEARTGADGKACGADVETDLRCIQFPLTIQKPIPNA